MFDVLVHLRVLNLCLFKFSYNYGFKFICYHHEFSATKPEISIKKLKRRVILYKRYTKQKKKRKFFLFLFVCLCETIDSIVNERVCKVIFIVFYLMWSILLLVKSTKKDIMSQSRKRYVPKIYFKYAYY